MKSKELTKEKFEWNFLKEHVFETTQSDFDEIEDIINDYGTKKEKQEYRKYFKKTKKRDKTMKLHKQLYYEGKGMTVNTTLCGRENKASWDTELEGTNVADSDEEVTCKFCLKMMEQKRVRKIKALGQEVEPVTQSNSKAKKPSEESK